MIAPVLVAAAVQPNPAEVSNDHFAVIVGGIVTLLVAVCGLAGIVVPLLLKTRRAAAVASDQTANNHDSNLRDDLDGKHDLLVTALAGLTRSVGVLQDGQLELYQLIKRDSDRIDDLETTIDRPPTITIEKGSTP